MHLHNHQAQQNDVKATFTDLLSPLFFTPLHTFHQPHSSPPSPSSKKGQVEKTSRPRKQFGRERGLNRGHWLSQQNKKYHWFLEIHYKHFVNRQMRRMDRIFKSMEIFIGTRQAEQCRSHHQKMEMKFHRFSAIIQNLRYQHYLTHDVQPLMQDLKLNGYQLAEELAPLSLLEEEELTLVGLQTKEKRKSGKSRSARRVQMQKVGQLVEGEEEQKLAVGQQGENEMINMLEESNLNIGQLKLYHDRVENSGLFNLQ